MNKLLLAIIVILALCSMAPGTPRPKPTLPVTEPPPVETQPVETEPPATEPVETEPVEPTDPVITEPVATDDWPGYVATKSDAEPKEYKLPAGGFGPPAQTAPACASMLIALAVFLWKLRP